MELGARRADEDELRTGVSITTEGQSGGSSIWWWRRGHGITGAVGTECGITERNRTPDDPFSHRNEVG